MTDQSPPNEPGPEEQRPRDDEPTAEQPSTEQPPAADQPTAQAPPAPGAEAPRRLFRSRSERMLGGVCGGLAAYLRIDPVIVRVITVALVFAGGAGILLYLAALLLVPNEGEDGTVPEGPRRGAAIVGAVLLICAIGVLLPFHGGWWFGGWWLVPLGLVALAGLLVWRLASGERRPDDPRSIVRAIALGVALLAGCFFLALGAAWAAAAGGGEVVAGIVIAAGVALVAGAFLGRGTRWLILPALAIALPAGVVQAAGIDAKGGVGDRTYRPTSTAEVRDGYRIGIGKLVVDLRDAQLTPGDHHINLDAGVGAVELVVPRNVCVSSSGHAGVGGFWVFNRNNGGVDVDWQDHRDAPAGTPRVIVDGDIGIGALLVNHTGDDHDFGRHFAANDPFNRNAGCL
jgi:phage shock protein PspC (stress-responsive transcriptional regulator)